MRRATITLPDDLESELEAFLATRDAPPSLTALMQAALRRYLEEARPGGAPYEVGPSGGASEVAEPVASYGTPPHGGGPRGPVPWGPPWPPRPGVRLGDLPDLLASLPRLSEAEAGALAADLASARADLAQADEEEGADRRNPWGD